MFRIQSLSKQLMDTHNLCVGLSIVNTNLLNGIVCLFALRHKSTAMVIAGRSVHLTTLFPGQA